MNLHNKSAARLISGRELFHRRHPQTVGGAPNGFRHVTSRRAKLVITGARLIVAQRFHYILVHGDYIRGFSLAHEHRMGRANVRAVMRVEFCNTRNVDFTDIAYTNVDW